MANPIGSRTSTMRSRPRSVPRIRFTLATRTRTGSREGRSPRWSAIPGARAASEPINSAKRRMASSTTSGSAPFSKRVDASLRNPSRRDVRAIDMGSHQAISRATVTVVPSISVAAPPITPAIPTATSSASATTPSAFTRVRLTPSRVSMVSPSTAQRARKPEPPTRSRSKVWLGWPNSSIT